MYSWQQRVVFWHDKKAENVVFFFKTSVLAAFICLWLFELPKSNIKIIYVLSIKYKR